MNLSCNPCKIKFSSSLSLSLCFSLYSISRISPSWARAGCKKTLCLLHYPRKIKFINSFIHSFSPPLSSPPLSLSLSLSLCLSVSRFVALLIPCIFRLAIVMVFTTQYSTSPIFSLFAITLGVCFGKVS